MRQFKTVEIGGLEFEIGQVGARLARDIGLRMLEVHGEVLAALGDVVDADGRERAVVVGGLGRALVALARAMRSKDFLEQVHKPLLEQVLQGKRRVLDPAVYDELFTGRLEVEMALLKACVDHNCGDFLKAFAETNEVTGMLREMHQRQAKSPAPATPAGEGEPSTGTSGPP